MDKHWINTGGIPLWVSARQDQAMVYLKQALWNRVLMTAPDAELLARLVRKALSNLAGKSSVNTQLTSSMKLELLSTGAWTLRGNGFVFSGMTGLSEVADALDREALVVKEIPA